MRSVLKYLSTGFLAALILLPLGAAAQDNRTVPSSHTEMQLSFAPLVKRTAGAVVNVYAERVV
jgi:S1-C subfamily serine protease